MNINNFFNKLNNTACALRPNEQLEDKYFQLIHIHCDHCYPYIPNITTYFGVYKIPYQMSYKDFFKILSYYTDKLDLISVPCSIEQVKYLSILIKDLKVDDIKCQKIINSNVFSTYFADGTLNEEYYNNNYEWYSKGISLNDVKKIYSKYKIEYQDAFTELLNNEEIVPRRVLVKSLTLGYK